MAYKTTSNTPVKQELDFGKRVVAASNSDNLADSVHNRVNRSFRAQDFYQLMKVFISEVRCALPCDGIKYMEERLGLSYLDGVIAHYQIDYNLTYNGQFLGKLCFSREHDFSDAELTNIEDLVARLVQPLSCALQYHQAVRFALRDDLTGLRNGSSYFDSITLEIERARRYKVPFSLLLINLDDFREINRKYGYTAGNTLLVEVARRLEHEARSSDIIFRKGGDEFLIFLPNTANRTAGEVAERIRKSVLSGSSIDESKDACFTMSIGAVTVMPDDSAFKLIGRADKALFHAKILGKNRIQTETEPESMLQEWI